MIGYQMPCFPRDKLWVMAGTAVASAWGPSPTAIDSRVHGPAPGIIKMLRYKVLNSISNNRAHFPLALNMPDAKLYV